MFIQTVLLAAIIFVLGLVSFIIEKLFDSQAYSTILFPSLLVLLSIFWTIWQVDRKDKSSLHESTEKADKAEPLPFIKEGIYFDLILIIIINLLIITFTHTSFAIALDSLIDKKYIYIDPKNVEYVRLIILYAGYSGSVISFIISSVYGFSRGFRRNPLRYTNLSLSVGIGIIAFFIILFIIREKITILQNYYIPSKIVPFSQFILPFESMGILPLIFEFLLLSQLFVVYLFFTYQIGKSFSYIFIKSKYIFNKFWSRLKDD